MGERGVMAISEGSNKGRQFGGNAWGSSSRGDNTNVHEINLTKSRCSQRFPLRRCAYSENSDRSRQRGSGRMFPYGGGRTRPAGLRCER
jgi:hypothetical protein